MIGLSGYPMNNGQDTGFLSTPLKRALSAREFSRETSSSTSIHSILSFKVSLPSTPLDVG